MNKGKRESKLSLKSTVISFAQHRKYREQSFFHLLMCALLIDRGVLRSRHDSLNNLYAYDHRKDLEHHYRTIYGDSKRNFGSNLWLAPCQGLGQGNGAGPQRWAVVSTPVLNYLRSEGCGVAFKASISGRVIQFGGYAFVTIVEGKVGGTTGKAGARSRYPSVRYGLPEVWDTGDIILDSAYLAVATLQGASH
jgi:hypothetical protein